MEVGEGSPIYISKSELYKRGYRKRIKVKKLTKSVDETEDKVTKKIIPPSLNLSGLEESISESTHTTSSSPISPRVKSIKSPLSESDPDIEQGMVFVRTRRPSLPSLFSEIKTKSSSGSASRETSQTNSPRSQHE